MDVLVKCKRLLQPVVNGLRLNKIVSPVYQSLLKWRYRSDRLASATQNGRTWKLHHEVALRGEYQEFETVQWLREVIKPGDCVFDVGANVGQMTLEAAELVGPHGKVLAIEPAPGNVRLLELHIEANGFADRVEIVQAACGSTHGGQIVLNIIGSETDVVGSGHNTRQQVESGFNSKLNVDLVSIDGICKQKGLVPKVIKIDVEGAELDVVDGTLSTLREQRPEVLVGFHPFAFADPRQATQRLLMKFKEHGYEVPSPNEQGEYVLAEYRMRPRKEA